jgi:hypothetical protein
VDATLTCPAVEAAGVWSAVGVPDALAGLLADVEVPEDAVPVSAGAVLPVPESVVGVVEVELAVPVVSAGGVELPAVSVPAEGSGAGVTAGDAAESAVVDEVDGSEPGVGVLVVGPAEAAGEVVPVSLGSAVGSLAAGGGCVSEPPFSEVSGDGAGPLVAPAAGLPVVGVEVPPPDVVEVLDGAAAGVPAGVELTVSGEGVGAVAETGTVDAAGRTGTEASSLSRTLAGAAAR